MAFHEEASAEYDAAFDWYVERSPEAALRFDAIAGSNKSVNLPSVGRKARVKLASSS